MAYLEETPCCGVQFIDSIDDAPAKIVRDVCEKKYGDDSARDWGDYVEHFEQAFLIFTDNVSDNDNGSDLAKYITKHNLGTYIVTRQRRNPNTDNMIKVWVWTPNERTLRAWWKKHNSD